MHREDQFIPHLIVNDCLAALKFYREVFGSTDGDNMMAPDGKRLMHGEIVHDVRGLDRSRVLRRALDRLDRVSWLGRRFLYAALEERTTSSSAGHDLGRCCVGNASVGQTSVGQTSVGQTSIGPTSVGQIKRGDLNRGNINRDNVFDDLAEFGFDLDASLYRRPIARFGWLTGA